MKMIICAVYDVKAEAHMQPFFAVNENMARRSFGDAVLNPETGISKHVSDYKLYFLGIFDDLTGSIECPDKPKFLANASDFVDVKKEVR